MELSDEHVPSLRNEAQIGYIISKNRLAERTTCLSIIYDNNGVSTHNLVSYSTRNIRGTTNVPRGELRVKETQSKYNLVS